jgi:arylsulfatase A-like enzyme
VTRPNVLMVAVDCLRSDRVFGQNRSCKTPNLDALAKRSLRLPNMFVETSTTAPAFASIFTGLYSMSHGITALLGVKLRQNLFTLADALTANGYYTHAEATGPLMETLGVNQGFDEYNFRDQRDYCYTEWGEKLIEKYKSGSLPEPWFSMIHFWEVHEPRQVPKEFDDEKFGATQYDRSVSALDSYLGKLFEAVGKDTVIIFTGDHGERISEPSTEEALLNHFMTKLDVKPHQAGMDERMGEDIELLNKRGKELHEVSANLATDSGAARSSLGIGERIKLLFKLIKVALTRARIQKTAPGQGSEGFFQLLKSKWEDMKIGFAVIRGDTKDAQMHLLRTTLSHFHLQHGYHVYDYLARVPFMIGGSIAPEDKTVESPVRNIDIFPSLCDALSLEVHDLGCHGASFWPMVQNGGDGGRAMYMEARGGAQAIHAFYIRGVRSGGYKVAYAPFDTEAPTELYDLGADPGEQKNVYEENKDLADKLRGEAEALAATFESDGSGDGISAEEQAATIEKLKSLGYM